MFPVLHPFYIYAVFCLAFSLVKNNFKKIIKPFIGDFHLLSIYYNSFTQRSLPAANRPLCAPAIRAVRALPARSELGRAGSAGVGRSR